MVRDDGGRSDALEGSGVLFLLFKSGLLDILAVFDLERLLQYLLASKEVDLAHYDRLFQVTNIIHRVKFSFERRCLLS